MTTPRKPSPPRVKPPKRAPGSGSVYPRKDGRWVASLTLGYQLIAGTTKRKRISQDTYHRTEAAARRWLDAANAEVEAGRYITPDKVTVGEYVTDWLENVVRPTKEPLTHLTYLKIARTHIIPALGPLPLQKLTPAQVQAMLTSVASGGGSVALVRYVKVVLGAALKQAVAWGLVQRNVASLALLPSYRTPEMHAPSKEEVGRLLAATAPHPLHAAFVIAAVLGLRVGEYLSLRWTDLDLTRETLRVRTTVQQVTGMGLLVKRAKTQSSERTIHLPNIVLRALVARRDIQALDGQAGAEYIFTTPQGNLYSPNRLRLIFYRLRAQAGIPKTVRLHDLRHFAATTALANGVPLPVVSKMLGHASVTITLKTYIHLIPEMQDSAVAKLNEIWG